MTVFYRIQHNGEAIAVADSIEQVRVIVRNSRPGAYDIYEVRDNPAMRGPLLSRCWGHVIRPDDGQVIMDSGEWVPEPTIAR